MNFSRTPIEADIINNPFIARRDTYGETPAPAPFADMANDLDALNAPARNPLKAAREPKPLFKVACLKCRGTGRYSGPSSHGSRCFACLGIGFKETKTDPAKLAENRAKASRRKAQNLSDALGAWMKANPAEQKWLNDNQARFDFASSLCAALERFGSLTPGQMAAIQRCMAKDVERNAARVVEQAKLAERAVEVNATKLEDAFKKASAALKRPKITLAKTTFKPAKADSKNPGAIYVTKKLSAVGEEYEGAYLGKVFGGKFFPSRDCSPEQQAHVVEIMNDPKRAAESYGRLTGNCCICSRALVDPVSVANGIGPICAERFGW